MVDEDKTFTPDADSDFAAADTGYAGADKPLKNKKRGAGAWLGYGALLLVLILVGAGVFLLRELRSQQEGLGSGLDKGDRQMQELLHQISNLQSEVATVHQQLATVQSQVTTEESKFEREIGEENAALSDKIEAVQGELGDAIQHIQRHLNQTRGNVRVADAEYLLSVANQRLHLVGDVKAVLAMMEAADQQLLESGDPATTPVRNALAEEIDLLKNFDPPDVVGISAKLLVLEGKVKELPLFLPHAERAKENHQPATGSADVAAEGNAVLDSLKGLVTVRRTGQPVEAILHPEEVVALRQVLLLKLEMSRAALLRGDDDMFKVNMDSAVAWLSEHFDGAAELTQSVAEDLKGLRDTQLRVPFPDVSQSLSLVRDIEKLRL
ncbi:MAG: uroporphyrinogen-III C-methyltransferase, partial [Candidatus Methylumidiphilus sp.]